MNIAYLADRYTIETIELIKKLHQEKSINFILLQQRKEKLPDQLANKKIKTMSMTSYLKEGRHEEIFMIDSYGVINYLDKVKTKYLIYVKDGDIEYSLNLELENSFRNFLNTLPIIVMEKSGVLRNDLITDYLKGICKGKIAGGFDEFNESQRNIFYFISEKYETMANIEKGYVWTREQYLTYKNLNIFKMIVKKIIKIFKGA